MSLILPTPPVPRPCRHRATRPVRSAAFTSARSVPFACTYSV
jgi:hypothetical protein